MRRMRGFSLIELLIVAAIAAVLLGIGFVQINSGGAATSQAAQAIAATVNRARFEAIRTNNTAGFQVIAADANQGGTIRVCSGVDESQALSCNTGTIASTVVLSDGDLARARIASPAQLTVFFDRRGIVRNPSSDGLVVTVTDRSGANARTVTIAATGRTEIQ